MLGKISVVINTLNEAKNIANAINSVKWADEILVCDMHSEDETPLIAKKMGAKVIFHKRVGYVEPARNFAISKSAHEWVLLLDADEEVSPELVVKLKEIINSETVVEHVDIPRKNMIFGKWVKASMWWPDYHPRFFKKGSVEWPTKIHLKPKLHGQGLQLAADERFALIHHHYTNVNQYLERLNRYTSVEAKDLVNEGYKFSYLDLIRKPLGEFLGRFFANRGFEDGVHGLVLSLLQAFSFLVVYIKVWEIQGFEQKAVELQELEQISKVAGKELKYWFKYGNLPKNPIKRFIKKVKNKLI